MERSVVLAFIPFPIDDGGRKPPSTQASLPVRILNRDFQRFDARLDDAVDSRERVAFLVESAGMPDRRAGSGGRATAHVLALQSFRLQVKRVGTEVRMFLA
jgi:hypothetical protein